MCDSPALEGFAVVPVTDLTSGPGAPGSAAGWRLVGSFNDWDPAGLAADESQGCFYLFASQDTHSTARLPAVLFKFKRDDGRGTMWCLPHHALRTVAVRVSGARDGHENLMLRSDALPVVLDLGPVPSDGGAAPWFACGSFNGWCVSGRGDLGDESVRHVAVAPGHWQLKLARPPRGVDPASCSPGPDWEWALHPGLVSDGAPCPAPTPGSPPGEGHGVVVSPACAGSTAVNPDARCAVLSVLQALHASGAVRAAAAAGWVACGAPLGSAPEAHGAAGKPARKPGGGAGARDGGAGCPAAAAHAATGSASALVAGGHPREAPDEPRSGPAWARSGTANALELFRPWARLRAANPPAERLSPASTAAVLAAMSSRVGPLPAWWTDPLAEHLRDDGTLEAGGGDARAVAPRVLELLGVAAGLDSPCIPVTMRAVPPQDWEAVGATTAALVAEGASAAVELASKGRAVAPAELDALPRCESQAVIEVPLPEGIGATEGAQLSQKLLASWAGSGLALAVCALPPALVLSLAQPVKAGDAAVPDTIDLFRFRPRGPADWLRSERRYLVRAVVLRHGATGQGAADSGHWTCARAPGESARSCQDAIAQRNARLAEMRALAAAAPPVDAAAAHRAMRAEAEAIAGWVHVDDHKWEWLPCGDDFCAAQLPAQAFVTILVLESLTPEIDDPEP